MADTKISALPVGVAITGAELLVAVQSGANVQTSPAAVLTYILGQTNTFLADQTVKSAANVLGLTFAGASGGGTPSIVATSPAQVASATAGTPIAITASPAIAGSSNAGAAAGGSITLTAGAAARLTSGNANGGNINLVTGAGIGTGTAGQVLVPQGSSAVPGIGFTGDTTTGLARVSGLMLAYAGTASLRLTGSVATFNNILVGWGNGDASVAQDTALKRSAAGVLEINNGTAGQWGSLKAGVRDANLSSIVDTLTLGHQISSGIVGSGCGIGIMFNIATNNAGTPVQDVNAARITVVWANADDGTRKAQVKFNVYDQTNTREVLRLETNGAAMIGFLGASAVVRQTSGANLTNNVTSGGTDNTVDTWTDLTIYATDAAAIRNAVYQLARKLKQVNDSLRTYGLLT